MFLLSSKLACARNSRADAISFVSFFLVIALNPCISNAQTVRISYAGLSGYNVPLWVSQEAGLFKKYGLPVELVLIDRSVHGVLVVAVGCAGQDGLIRQREELIQQKE